MGQSPIPGSSIEVTEEDDQDDNDTSSDNLEDLMQEVNSNVDPDEISTIYILVFKTKNLNLKKE